MINLELAIKLAEEYGFEIKKVKAGEGGMFYIDGDTRKVNVNDLDFENDNNMNIKLSQNEHYKTYGRRENMYTFAA